MDLKALPVIALLSVIGVCFFVALLRSVWRSLRWGLSAGDAMGRIELPEYGFLGLIVIISIAVLTVPPFAASNLAISDSVEYAVGAERAVDVGGFSLSIEGREYPPRYAPWFSLFVLAPAYVASGKEIGAMIIPVTLLAILGVVAAYCIGRRISSVWGGMIAAFALLLDPGYRYFSGFPMTDVPSAAVLLIFTAAFLAVHNNTKRDRATWAELGCLVAMLGAWRPTSFAAVLPLLWLCFRAPGDDRRVLRLGLSLAPITIMLGLHAAYNTAVFGSPFRNGYHFWLPWPYQVFSAVFSSQYLEQNLSVVLTHTAVPIFAVVVLASLPLMKPAAVSLRLQQMNFRRLLLCIALIGVPLLGFYLPYFYSTSRFYLPLCALMYACIGATIGGFLGSLDRQYTATFLTLILIAAASLGWRASKEFNDKTRRFAVEYIKRHTPNDALIVGGLDPVYVEPFILRGTKRTYLPYSRRIEFASKTVAWSDLQFTPPYPSNPHEAAREFVLRHGGGDVVATVVSESPEIISRAIETGRPVFIDISGLEPAEVEAFTHRFVIKEAAPELYSVVGPWTERQGR